MKIVCQDCNGSGVSFFDVTLNNWVMCERCEGTAIDPLTRPSWSHY